VVRPIRGAWFPLLQVCTCAVELLEMLAATSRQSLEMLLLAGPCGASLLEALGRCVATKPQLTTEVALLTGLTEQELAEAMMPRVVGWICANKATDELAILAHLLDREPASLLMNHAQFAVAHALWLQPVRLARCVLALAQLACR